MKLEKGGHFQNDKPKCITHRKRHYRECLNSTESCFCCCKEGHEVRDCPSISSTGREGKQVSPNVLRHDAPNKRHFYALRTRGENMDGDDDEGKSLHLSFYFYEFFISEGVWLVDGIESHRSMLQVHDV